MNEMTVKVVAANGYTKEIKTDEETTQEVLTALAARYSSMYKDNDKYKRIGGTYDFKITNTDGSSILYLYIDGSDDKDVSRVDKFHADERCQYTNCSILENLLQSHYGFMSNNENSSLNEDLMHE